jgi:hypothetical protein
MEWCGIPPLAAAAVWARKVMGKDITAVAWRVQIRFCHCSATVTAPSELQHQME